MIKMNMGQEGNNERGGERKGEQRQARNLPDPEKHKQGHARIPTQADTSIGETAHASGVYEEPNHLAD